MFVRGQLALCVLALASSGSECGLGGRGRDPERLLLPVQPSRAGRGVTPGFGTWHAGQASPEQQPTERAHAGARRVWCLGSVCEVYAPGAAHATAEAENAHGQPAASRRPGRPTAESLRRSRGPGRTGADRSLARGEGHQPSSAVSSRSGPRGVGGDARTGDGGLFSVRRLTRSPCPQAPSQAHPEMHPAGRPGPRGPGSSARSEHHAWTGRPARHEWAFSAPTGQPALTPPQFPIL